MRWQTGPSPDIGVDSWPKELAGHQTLSCPDTGVGKGMKCIKNCSTETFRYVRAEHYCGYIRGWWHHRTGPTELAEVEGTCQTVSKAGQGCPPELLP